MTAVNSSKGSSKGLFGTYFKYRLGVMKINFVMCCILNVLGLPLYAVAANMGFGGVDSEFAVTARVFSMICILALPLIAIFNALSSFDYYHKKDLTDTIGALSISHKERFFADLLVGLIVNAVPVIPCGIICAIIMGGAQGRLDALERAENIFLAGVGFEIAATVLFIVIFAYLFTVLTSVCCGKAFHSAVFSVIAIITLPLLFGGMARCFANGILGIDSKEHFTSAVTFFPPAGILEELFGEMDVPFTSDPALRVKWLVGIFDFAHILVYVILAAGLVAAAYFLSKRRLAEHTGSAFAIKPMFWVLSGGITAASTIMAIGVIFDYVDYYYIVAAAFGLFVCLVTVLFYRQKKKTFLRSLVVGVGAVVVMLAAWFVIDKTGAFGARYYPKSADKIEYVKINDTYKITDKKDIETYFSKLNDELRNAPSGMVYGNWGGFFVEVKKTDGTSTLRGYDNANAGEEIFRSLDGYMDYFFNDIESSLKDWTAHLSYKNVTSTIVRIPDEKLPELIEILREEAVEKHDPNAKTVAEIVFSCNIINARSFAVEENFTRAIAFLTDTAVYNTDPAILYLRISYDIYGEDWDSFSIEIPFGDKDDARVKELVSLLEDCGDDEPIEGFKIKANFNSENLGVTEKNKARVLELMKQLAMENMLN